MARARSPPSTPSKLKKLPPRRQLLNRWFRLLPFAALGAALYHFLVHGQSHHQHGSTRFSPSTKWLWRSPDFSTGVMQMPLHVDQKTLVDLNITGVRSGLRYALLEPVDSSGYSNHAPDGFTTLHIFFYSWDLPLAHTRYIIFSQLFNHVDVSYHVTLYRPGKLYPPYKSGDCVIRGDLEPRHGNLQCFVPKQLIEKPKNGSDSISVTLHIVFRGRTINQFPFALVAREFPVSKLAICGKPMWTTKVDLQDLIEWREHHRMLGFDVVHWSHRDSNFAITVERLNNMTGARDTFDWIPDYDAGQKLESFFWEEKSNFNQCYVLYRFLSDWLGIWDLDEWFSMSPDQDWTASRVARWLRDQEKRRIGSAQIRWTYIDRGAAGNVPSDRLLQANPRLTSEALADIQRVILNHDSQFRPDATERLPFYKSLHFTRAVRHAETHFHTDMDPSYAELRNDSETTMFHVRWRINLVDPKKFTAFSVTKTISLHWLALSRTVKAMLAASQLR